MLARFRAWDDYFIPGTTVLRNKFNERDATTLQLKEEQAARLRLIELAANPVAGDFDYAHMKAIHGRIFQDVYEWAGQERVGPDSHMTKGGPDVVHFAPGDPAAPMIAYSYYPGALVADAAEEQYRRLAAKGLLRGLPQEEFLVEFAEIWGELNVVHSFREGNTRAQFVFFSQLAEQAGYRIDAAQFAVGQPLRDEFVNARFYSQATGSNGRLVSVLGRAIAPLVRPSLEQRIEDAVRRDVPRKVDPAHDPGRTRRLKGYGR
ncbi:Fic/DOC family protein [Plantibacter sp. RU18]|uniref:Fic/DOC family protein n=1 Tax=Plantibacter sp. RU18 TaxID=3158143 RepID=UPI003D36E7BA